MSKETPAIDSCVPPRIFSRNQYGLICDKDVHYVYNDDGTINWRKMIRPEHVVPHSKQFEEKGLPVPETTVGLDDNQVLILLQGIKDLASIRGYSGVEYEVKSPCPEYVVATCKITWIPNYETNNQSVVFSAIGDANPRNTSPRVKDYLGPIAENRAFVRAVRNFLKIPILSSEEIGGANSPMEDDIPTNLLKETMAKYELPFEKIKAKLVAEGVQGADGFSSVSDIPRVIKLELVERIKRKAEKLEKAKTAEETV